MRALLALMLGALVALTTEYLPIGLLPQIAASLGVSETRAGALVTGYAWIAALSAIPLTLATRRISRRGLFLGLLGINAAANALATFSSTYWMLAALRILTALTHGVFWSMIAAYAVRLAPAMPASRATAWALGGISLALVVGVPTATAIGHWASWRLAFGAYAVLGGLAIVLGLVCLPPARERDGAPVRGLPRSDARLYMAGLVTMLIVATHFVGYTYIVPVLTDVVHLPETRHALALMSFGMAGVAGTWLAGWLRVQPMSLSLMAAIGVVISQGGMLLSGSAEAFAWLEMACWGASIALLIVGLQSWVIEIAPEQADAASSLYVAAFNLGIGSGALIGGIALSVGGTGSILKASLMLGALALLTFAVPWRLQKRRLSAT